VGKGVRPLDGQHGHEPGSTYCFGVLVYPDGRERVCESAGGSTGPYSAYRYSFTDCLTGERITLTGDRETTPPVGQWRPITSAKRLKALTGLEPPVLRDGSILWEGAWWTKERRNPIMRGIASLCEERYIACTHHELKAILLNDDPEFDWCNPRFNNTRDFAERVADSVAAGEFTLRDAITHHYRRDIQLTPRWCWWQGTRQDRKTSWCAPAARDVDVVRLADAGGLPILLAKAESAVHTAECEIDSEITDAKLDAAGGALQEHLFDPTVTTPVGAAEPKRLSVADSAPASELLSLL
jgi:hypothetical protein